MKTIFRMQLRTLLFVCCVFVFSTSFADKAAVVSQATLDKVKKASVTIQTTVSQPCSDLFGVGTCSGSGFVVNKNMGIICTNAHIVGRVNVPDNFVITFYNGKKAEAKLLYLDNFWDLAFLKIAPKDMSNDVSQLSFSQANSTKEGDKVFSVSNTELASFSFSEGYVSDIYSIGGSMPQRSYTINSNQVGGASGSAILNTSGSVVGVLYGCGKTYELALNGEYVKYLSQFLSAGKIPVRKHIGAIVYTCSLDDMVKFNKFPEDIASQYMKNNEKSRGKVLFVDSIIPGSPAEGILQPGDILWKVDSHALGADLLSFDTIMNKATSPLKCVVFRDGQCLDLSVPVFDLSNYSIKNIVNFNGARFLEADPILARYKGVPLGSLMCGYVEDGSPFALRGNYTRFCGFSVHEINGVKVKSLEDFLRVAKGLKNSAGFSIRGISRVPFRPWYFITASENFFATVRLGQDNTLDVYNFDSMSCRWIKTSY
ncbi:trypsin-like peptidase domain-containing protein [Candidatus Sneabacter namystus]|uniref:Serine protease n=1 Tax=Candidatus Sneabacter namystus TaxID=2601646 RepID=A0A5C0UI07_9RICK|nr:trypsin-like peptidase domain-containing protein [Candidatus Sneabacter namystus]QEK39728.1 hypothetical protein FZC37_02195 [Candidatus Sneabacter namystus]